MREGAPKVLRHKRHALVVVVLVVATAVVTMSPSEAAARQCFGRVATVVGTPGADVLHGTAGPDVIVSRGGADVIRAGSGNDRVCAGSGRDVVVAGAGNDRIDIGRQEADRVHGGPGDDWLGGTDRRVDLEPACLRELRKDKQRGEGG